VEPRKALGLMGFLRHVLTGFLAGEISPYLAGRVETDQYAYGLASCENFVPVNEGPLVKRPGFAYVNDAAETASWLSAFRRGVTQEYVIEWLEEAVRFYTNGGRIEDPPGTPTEAVTPYPAAVASTICSQQNYDRLYLGHGDYPPAALRRDDAVTFVHEELALLNGPFSDGNTDATITVTASAVSGAGITLTASSAIFASGHVGAPFRLEARDFSDVKAWETQMDGILAGDLVRNEGRVYEAASPGKTGTVPPTHSDGTEWDGIDQLDVPNAKGPYGVPWTFLHDRFGIATITAIGGGGTTATATVVRRLPNSVTTVASWRWAHAALSDEAGWPHLVSIGFGRLLLWKDFDILGSVVGDYGGGRVNFAAFSDVGVLTDDLAFRRTMSLEEPPLWVQRDKQKLILGLPAREVAVGPLNSAAAFSGANISVEDQSFYGSELVWPVQFGTETIFVERGGGRLRSADFDFARDRYDATDLTAAAGHICTGSDGGGIVQLAHQRAPQALVYAVRSDGQLVVHSKSRLEIKGFSRTVLGDGARAKSAVSIYGEDGRTEELWLLVERERGEDTVREIWRQMPWRRLGDAQAEQFFVDGGIRIEASAGQTLFEGLDWLAGQAVAVLAGGAVVSGLSVTEDGALTVPAAATPKDNDGEGVAYTLIVGLGYTAEAITLPPAARNQAGAITGLLQRVIKLATRVLETVGLKIGVPGTDRLEELMLREPGDAMDAPIPLKTGDFGGEVEAGFDRLGRARWVSSDPVAAIVAAAMINLDVSERDV
jgi:hypothetical protein